MRSDSAGVTPHSQFPLYMRMRQVNDDFLFPVMGLLFFGRTRNLLRMKVTKLSSHERPNSQELRKDCWFTLNFFTTALRDPCISPS